jgi:uncharacterized protein (DUF1015 family)
VFATSHRKLLGQEKVLAGEMTKARIPFVSVAQKYENANVGVFNRAMAQKEEGRVRLVEDLEMQLKDIEGRKRAAEEYGQMVEKVRKNLENTLHGK